MRIARGRSGLVGATRGRAWRSGSPSPARSRVSRSSRRSAWRSSCASTPSGAAAGGPPSRALRRRRGRGADRARRRVRRDPAGASLRVPRLAARSAVRSGTSSSSRPLVERGRASRRRSSGRGAPLFFPVANFVLWGAGAVLRSDRARRARLGALRAAPPGAPRRSRRSPSTRSSSSLYHGLTLVKSIRYFYPAYPALAVLAGALARAALRRRRRLVAARARRLVRRRRPRRQRPRGRGVLLDLPPPAHAAAGLALDLRARAAAGSRSPTRPGTTARPSRCPAHDATALRGPACSSSTTPTPARRSRRSCASSRGRTGSPSPPIASTATSRACRPSSR